MLLFPNFQRSSGRILPPLFKRECKGKGLYITTKIICWFFFSFWSEFQLVLTRTKTIFLRRIAKIWWHYLPTNFYSFICSHHDKIVVNHVFRELILFLRGCKDKFEKMTTKCFLKSCQGFILEHRAIVALGSKFIFEIILRITYID